MSKEFASEFEAHINTIKDQLVKRGYEKTQLENQIEKVAKLDRIVCPAEQNKSQKASCLPLSVTYYRTLPNKKKQYLSNSGTFLKRIQY